MSEGRVPHSAPESGSVTVRASVDDPDLRAVREALGDLRREIRTRFRREPERVSPPAAPAWERLLSEVRHRLATLGMRERSGAVDEFGMEEAALQSWRPVLDFLYDRYWRVDVGGASHLPERGPCLLVANRSGILPYDALMVAHAVERESASGERPRFTVADWLVSLPFVQPRLARLGGVRACRENVDRLLAAGRSVCVFPEGAKGAAKTYRDRYRLQRFGRGGVIRAALECGVPLVPVGVVGAEETNPILWKATRPGRALGVRFVPVTPTFPLLGPLGVVPLPSQWVLRFGAPLELDALPADAARDELLLSRLTEQLRGRIHSLVQSGLRARDTVWSLRADREGGPPPG